MGVNKHFGKYFKAVTSYGANSGHTLSVDSLEQEKPIFSDRHLLWIGKLAFPEIDTQRTKLRRSPSGYQFMYSDLGTGELERIEIRKWVYKSGRHHVTARLGYSPKTDVLFFIEPEVIAQAGQIPLYK